MTQPGYTNTEKSSEGESRGSDTFHQYTMIVRITAAAIRTAITQNWSSSLIGGSSDPTWPVRTWSALNGGRGSSAGRDGSR